MYDKIEKILSRERLDPYLKLSGNNKDKALELYILYTKINESLYIPLQNIEIAVRNSFYESIALKYGYNWIIDKTYLTTGLSRNKDLLLKKLDFVYKDKPNPTITDIISNVSLSFWTVLLDDDFEVEIWRPCLYKLFNKSNNKLLRKDIRTRLKNIKEIRNRVFHHENPLKYDLLKSFNDIIDFIRLLSNDLAQITLQNTNFIEIYNQLNKTLDK